MVVMTNCKFLFKVNQKANITVLIFNTHYLYTIYIEYKKINTLVNLSHQSTVSSLYTFNYCQKIFCLTS